MTDSNKTVALQTMEALHRRDLDGVRANMAQGSRFYGWAPEPLDAAPEKGAPDQATARRTSDCRARPSYKILLRQPD